MAENEMDTEAGDSRFERLRQWSKTPTVRREKLTTEQVLQRMDSDGLKVRDRYKEAAASGGIARMVRLGLACVLAAGTLGVVWMEDGAAREHNQAMAEQSSQQRELTGEIADARDEARVNTMDPEKLAETMRAAKARADEVSEVQNRYNTVQLSTQAGEDGRVVVVGAEELTQMRQSLGAMFAPTSTTGTGFDPTSSWYTMWAQDEQGVWGPADPKAYAWEASRVWSAQDEDSARVVWQLRDTKTEELLGWTSATYRTSSNTFEKVEKSLTVQGRSRVAPTDETGREHPEPSAPAPQEQTQTEEADR